MKINLLCSNRLLPTQLFKLEQQSQWAGIDRGALILVENGIEPVFSVGDFDSVNEEERHILKDQLNIHPVKAEKDDTDLALGVQKAVQQGYSTITIYGATGGRLDHFMGVLQILQKPEYLERHIHLRVIDVQNEITLLNEGEHQVKQDSTYPYISFIPLNDEVSLSLEGFKYNLSNEHLELGSTLTISNEITTKVAKVNVEKGTVLQMRSTD
ncbi:thiamine diphosphokinase [Staphylococcus capitis]|uniref:thiamine diphosphokinase n=1 Tax=Staphylococcus capitis TaxID=29388 RepID=UPI001D13CB9F|nr:thiamine diphosphokinase [Staphylococcus capitis]MCC3754988.1 thiamine diphosphokinase [Staphylococcus capitis]MDH8730159.1 thiamine diphosphokinase [Staphylococcus capitis]MDH8922674.1 thiamine diphosphokinase [Staphylococcus capitis]MDH8943968.1 thiamine diphosphokinase [Staphylococcus capitis]MDH9592094.1 thiamine diphosphokinase [Staphylococcus capitis]